MSLSYEIQIALYGSEMKDYAFSYLMIRMDIFTDMHIWHFNSFKPNVYLFIS